MIEVEIKRGSEVRTVMLEHDEIVIGRRNEMREVQLDLTPDELVSRVHARAWLAGDKVFLEDLGSSGGSYVDGERLVAAMEILPQAEVMLGGTKLTLRKPLSAHRRGGAPQNKPNPGRPRPERRPDRPTGSDPSKSRSDAVNDGRPVKGIHIDLTTDAGQEELVYDLDEIFVGRTHPEQEIHLDLSSDLKVSRTHARIWRTRGICWVEDLNSTHGTLVNGEALSGALVVNPTDEVRIGGAVMRFRYDNGHSAMPKRRSETPALPATQEEDDCAFEALDSYPVYKEESYRYFEPGHRKKTDLDSVLKSRKSPMGRIRPNRQLALSESGQAGSGSKEFLELLPELVAQIYRAKNNEALADWFVNGVTKWLPTAKRAAFFVVDHGTGRIRLQAHRPALKPILSDTLAHRALEIRTGYSWQQVGKEECVRRLSMNAGLYVPMIFGEEELGLLCVEDTDEDAEFNEADLAALMVVGQLLSLAVRHHLAAEAADVD
ncbi:MAG: FHA domain-containing protein [Limisphaerales bacterium]